MPQTVEDLGKLVKSKYPGVYDSIPDMDLGRKVKSKHPQYSQFQDVPEVPKPPLPHGLQTEEQQVAAGTREPPGTFGSFAGAVEDFAPAGIRQGAEGLARMAQPGGRAKAEGASQLIRGVGRAAAPFVAPAALMAPAATAVSLAGGAAAEGLVGAGAKALGVPKEYGDLAGDVAGILAGLGTGKTVSFVASKLKPYASILKANPALQDMVLKFVVGYRGAHAVKAAKLMKDVIAGAKTATTSTAAESPLPSPGVRAGGQAVAPKPSVAPGPAVRVGGQSVPAQPPEPPGPAVRVGGAQADRAAEVLPPPGPAPRAGGAPVPPRPPVPQPAPEPPRTSVGAGGKLPASAPTGTGGALPAPVRPSVALPEGVPEHYAERASGKAASIAQSAHAKDTAIAKALHANGITAEDAELMTAAEWNELSKSLGYQKVTRPGDILLALRALAKK